MTPCPLCGTSLAVATPKDALDHFDACLAVPRIRNQPIPTRLARITDRVIGFIADICPTKS